LQEGRDKIAKMPELRSFGRKPAYLAEIHENM